MDKNNNRVAYATLGTFLLLGLGVGAWAEIVSNGSSVIQAGDIITHNIGTASETGFWAGFMGNETTDVYLEYGGDSFLTFGESNSHCVLATTYTEPLNEATIVKLTEADLTALDTLYSLTGSESFSTVFNSQEELIFGNNYNDTAHYRTLDSGSKTYIVKRIGATVTALDEVVFVTKIDEGMESYNATQVDYEVLVGTPDGAMRTYFFSVV